MATTTISQLTHVTWFSETALVLTRIFVTCRNESQIESSKYAANSVCNNPNASFLAGRYVEVHTSSFNELSNERKPSSREDT
jgi:hypothetical protein